MPHRWFSGGGLLALVVSVALSSLSCASAGHNHAGGDGGGGGGDQGGNPVDFAGIDLFGVDLYGFDLGSTPDAGACVVLPQSGCGTNEKCTLDSTGTICLSDGDKQNGQICGAAMADDCVKGELCTSESASIGQCRQFCAADSDCKQAAAGGPANNVGHCLVTLTGATQKVCTVACNPVGSVGCGAGLGCELFAFLPAGVDGGATLYQQGTDCTQMGAGGDAANCATNGNADCTPGFGCVSVTTGGTTVSHCRKVCHVAGDCTGISGATCSLPQGASPYWGFCCPGGNC